MKNYLLVICLIFPLIFSCVSYSDSAQMKITLVKIVNQLESIKPLINRAKTEQNKHSRVLIHFDSWVDQNGNERNGLREDIVTIQKSLIKAVNRGDLEPRIYQPLRDDFVGAEHV